MKKILVWVKAGSYEHGDLERITEISDLTEFKETFKEVLKEIHDNPDLWNWTNDSELKFLGGRWEHVPRIYQKYPKVSKEVLDRFSEYLPPLTERVDDVIILEIKDKEILL